MPGGPGRPRRRGRPRRDSTSTDEANSNYGPTRYIEEKHVLKRTKLVNSDEWPTFVLTDATVYRRTADGDLVMALATHVDTEGPFVVRGNLEVDDDMRDSLRIPDTKTAYIEIPKSYSYSISYGPSIVWVSGIAGWYEIKPSQEYRVTYNKVLEEIRLYYTIMDAYESSIESQKLGGKKTSKGKWTQPSLGDVYFEYATDLADGSTLPDVRKRCKEYAPFLLAQFPKESGFAWSQTLFFQEMHRLYPDIYKRIKDAEAVRPPIPNPATLPSPSPVPPDIREILTAPARPVRLELTHRSRRTTSVENHDSGDDKSNVVEQPSVSTPLPLFNDTNVSTPTSTTTQGLSNDPPQDPVAFILDIFEVLANGKKPIDKLSETSIRTRMYFDLRVKAYDTPYEILHFYVNELIAQLPSKWHVSPLWAWLQKQKHQVWSSQTLQPRDLPGQLVSRQKKTVFIPRGARGSLTGPSGKSFVAGKGVPLTNGKVSALRVPGTSKRKVSDLGYGYGYDDDDDDRDDGSRASKAPKTSHLFDDSATSSFDYARQSVDVDDQDETDDDGDDDIDDNDDDGEAVSNQIASEMLRVKTIKLPSMAPRGPHGTWTCSETACGFVVRAANEPEGKMQISAHFRDHEVAYSEKKIDLAVAEGTKGHLPIEHLLDKIRSMGEAALVKESRTIKGIAVPPPIKRRVHI